MVGDGLLKGISDGFSYLGMGKYDVDVKAKADERRVENDGSEVERDEQSEVLRFWHLATRDYLVNLVSSYTSKSSENLSYRENCLNVTVLLCFFMWRTHLSSFLYGTEVLAFSNS
ncbi:hypothetical protein FRX31_021355, partial [Thalictrum thalictroides]